MEYIIIRTQKMLKPSTKLLLIFQMYLKPSTKCCEYVQTIGKTFLQSHVTQCYLTCHVANVSCIGHLFLVSSHRPSEILGIPRPQGWPNCSLFPYFDAFIYTYIYIFQFWYISKYKIDFLFYCFDIFTYLFTFPYFDIYIYTKTIKQMKKFLQK
jgi:hypothetical protein